MWARLPHSTVYLESFMNHSAAWCSIDFSKSRADQELWTTALECLPSIMSIPAFISVKVSRMLFHSLQEYLKFRFRTRLRPNWFGRKLLDECCCLLGKILVWIARERSIGCEVKDSQCEYHTLKLLSGGDHRMWFTVPIIWKWSEIYVQKNLFKSTVEL